MEAKQEVVWLFIERSVEQPGLVGEDHDEDVECEPARQQSQAFHVTNGNPTPPRAPPT